MLALFYFRTKILEREREGPDPWTLPPPLLRVDLVFDQNNVMLGARCTAVGHRQLASSTRCEIIDCCGNIRRANTSRRRIIISNILQ